MENHKCFKHKKEKKYCSNVLLGFYNFLYNEEKITEDNYFNCKKKLDYILKKLQYIIDGEVDTYCCKKARFIIYCTFSMLYKKGIFNIGNNPIIVYNKELNDIKMKIKDIINECLTEQHRLGII